MLQEDIIILTSAVASFIVFFILQVLIFRYVHPEAILKWIMNIFWLSSLLHIFWFFEIRMMWPEFLPVEAIGIVALSYFVFGLMAFVYILCVFGPSETSIRIRVVRELREGQGHRLSHEELLKRYNGRMVLERRLQRFLQSGEIRLEQGKYTLCKNANAFFMIDAVAQVIQKILGKLL